MIPVFKIFSYINGFYIATKISGLVLVIKDDFSLFLGESLKKFQFVSEKYIIAQKSTSGCGLVDIDGNILIDFIYHDISIKEGFICVRKDNQWHVIDIDGNIHSSSSKIINAISEFKKSKIFRNNQYIKLDISVESEKINEKKNNKKKQIIEESNTENKTASQTLISDESKREVSNKKVNITPEKNLENILNTYFKTEKRQKNKNQSKNIPDNLNQRQKSELQIIPDRKKRPRIKIKKPK